MTFAIPSSWRFPPETTRTVPRRLPNEFYPTPPEATRALLSVEDFDGPIWEPACGDGRIAKVLSDHGHAVISTDLHAYGFGVAGVDFLKETDCRAKHIVTNPPYGFGLADRFVRRALMLTQYTGGKVAMLLNMASLCTPMRTDWWRETPPARLYAIDDIVCWPEDRYGPPPHHFTKHRYVWAVWTHGHKGPPAFWWLSGAEFRAPIQSRQFNSIKGVFHDQSYSHDHSMQHRTHGPQATACLLTGQHGTRGHQTRRAEPRHRYASPPAT